MATVSAGPVVDVVVDELDIHISLDLGASAHNICISSYGRKVRIVQRISQESIYHFGCRSIILIVDSTSTLHEFSDLFVVYHPLFPAPVMVSDLRFIGPAAGSIALIVLGSSWCKYCENRGIWKGLL